MYEGWQIAAGRELDQLGGLLFDSFGTFLIVEGELALVDAFLEFCRSMSLRVIVMSNGIVIVLYLHICFYIVFL